MSMAGTLACRKLFMKSTCSSVNGISAELSCVLDAEYVHCIFGLAVALLDRIIDGGAKMRGKFLVATPSHPGREAFEVSVMGSTTEGDA